MGMKEHRKDYNKCVADAPDKYHQKQQPTLFLHSFPRQKTSFEAFLPHVQIRHLKRNYCQKKRPNSSDVARQLPRCGAFAIMP